MTAGRTSRSTDRRHPDRRPACGPTAAVRRSCDGRALSDERRIFAFTSAWNSVSVPRQLAVFAVRSDDASFRGDGRDPRPLGDGFSARVLDIVQPSRRRPAGHRARDSAGDVIERLRAVHFAELDHGRAVNPLALRHWARTGRRIRRIGWRSSAGAPELLPEFVYGVLQARRRRSRRYADRPSLGPACDAAPAKLTWWIAQREDGAVVAERSRSTFGRRSRRTLAFSGYYARGLASEHEAPSPARRAWRHPASTSTRSRGRRSTRPAWPTGSTASRSTAATSAAIASQGGRSSSCATAAER